ncbi:MAG: hypothetical protein ACRD0D_13685, partial [Acidimicrobiales bacterium]
VHLLHVDDLVAGLCTLGTRGAGVFLFAGAEASPISRILERVAEGAGLGPPVFGLPLGPLRLAASATERLWRAAGLDGEGPLTHHSLDVVSRDRAYTPTRATAELGWAPRVGLDRGLRETGEWLAKPAGSGLGFEWKGYFRDPDEGLGTVYERFALERVLQSAIGATGATSVLHAPLFGMMGIPGLDAVFLAQAGVRVGLLDFDAERMEAVRSLWEELGLEVETHLVPSADPATWPDDLGVPYDLVFSFAALWWFDDPWAVLAAQARWARRGLLVAVPNRNVFMRLRAKVWHRDLFRHLNAEALDPGALDLAAAANGLNFVDDGLFDIPPFPDTSVPLAKVVRSLLGKGDDHNQEGAWRWSILPYLTGEQPDLREKVARLEGFERRVPKVVAPHWAHHRYALFVPSRGAVTQMM